MNSSSILQFVSISNVMGSIDSPRVIICSFSPSLSITLTSVHSKDSVPTTILPQTDILAIG